MPVADPPGHRTHQLRMRNRIEVAAQIRFNHLTMTAPRQPVHRAYCVVRTVPGSVRVLLRLQVGLEDRLHHQHRRRLHHPVTYRRDSQGPLPSVRLLQPHPAHRGGSIALVPELLRQLPKPRLLYRT